MNRLARLAWVAATLALGVAPSLVFVLWAEAMGRNPGFGLIYAWVLQWPLVPQSAAPLLHRALFDVSLLLGFGVLHSGLAQVPVQDRLARVVGAANVRALYVITTGLALWLVIACWQVLGGTAWTIVPESNLADRVGQVLFYVMMVLAGVSIAGPGAPEFLGIAPAWRGTPTDERTAGNPKLVQRGAYRFVRHPGYAFTLAALLCSNTMGLDRLAVFAGAALYLAFGIPLEERKLVQIFGEDYEDYRRRVPALIPFPRF